MVQPNPQSIPLEHFDHIDNVERLKSFLMAQPQADLVHRLMDLAALNRELHRDLWHWHIAGARQTGDIHTLAQLASAMLTPSATTMPADEVPRYVQRATRAVPLLQELKEHDADTAARIIERAMLDAWTVGCESTDDEPDAVDFSKLLAVQWLQTLAAMNPQAPDFAQRVLNLLQADPWCTFELHQILNTIDERSAIALAAQLKEIQGQLGQRS